MEKLKQVLAPGSNLKGKALPSGLASLDFDPGGSQGFHKGKCPLASMDSSLTFQTTPLKEQ